MGLNARTTKRPILGSWATPLTLELLSCKLFWVGASAKRRKYSTVKNYTIKSYLNVIVVNSNCSNVLSTQHFRILPMSCLIIIIPKMLVFCMSSFMYDMLCAIMIQFLYKPQLSKYIQNHIFFNCFTSVYLWFLAYFKIDEFWFMLQFNRKSNRKKSVRLVHINVTGLVLKSYLFQGRTPG